MTYNKHNYLASRQQKQSNVFLSLMLVKNANFLKKRQISSFLDTLRALIFAKQILATKGFNNYEFCGTKFCGINFHVWVTFIHFAENFADFAEFLLRLRMFFGSFTELNFAIKDASINFAKFNLTSSKCQKLIKKSIYQSIYLCI